MIWSIPSYFDETPAEISKVAFCTFLFRNSTIARPCLDYSGDVQFLQISRAPSQCLYVVLFVNRVGVVFRFDIVKGGRLLCPSLLSNVKTNKTK